MKHKTKMMRLAMTLAVMVITATTASAFKTVTNIHHFSCNNKGVISIVNVSNNGQVTAQWNASTGDAIYYWAADNNSHSLADAFHIRPVIHNVNYDYQHRVFRTNQETRFYVGTDSHDIFITKVAFMNGTNEVSSTNSYNGAGTSFSLILPAGTSFDGIVVTYGYIRGSCGTNAKWELSMENGKFTTLTISGSGAMKDYYYETVGNDDTWRTDAPWDWQDLKKVIIKDGITSIGEYAFIGCKQLATVTIGTGVTTLGAFAFNHCDDLTEVTLPANVASIGEQCFRNSGSLQRVNIQHTDELVTLGSKCFNGCNDLQYIVVPTPAFALQYMAATNWKASADKIYADFAGYAFHVTHDEGGAAAYEIANETDLRNFAAAVNKGTVYSEGMTFCQTDDITLSSTNFEPIGKKDDTGFYGTYDGGGHTISGLQISRLNNIQYYGLFGCFYSGTIKNVRLINPSVDLGNVDNSTYYAALIGRAYHSTVENCVVYNPNVEGSGGTKRAIIGVLVDRCTLQNLYFYEGNCSNAIGNSSYSTITNVGRACKVTLGSGISSISPTISPTATNLTNGFVYKNNSYFREGLVLTLTSSISEKTGYHINYKADNKIISNPYTVNSTDGDVTLTAEQKVNTYTVHFVGNGSTSGSMSDQDFTYGVAQKLTANAFTRKNHTFAGWAKSANGDVVYDDKASVNNLTDTDGATVTLYAKWTVISVPYIDANGNEQMCNNYTVLTNETDVSNLNAGWYAVKENVSYNSGIHCNSGDIHLILCDGAKMTVTIESNVDDTAIRIDNGNLTIYAQSTGSSMGQLEATGNNSAGLVATGNITICGGRITATGKEASGIVAMRITIHSGQINATTNSDIASAISANINLTFGLRNATDYITANRYNYYYNGLRIADGQTLTDGTNIYSGELTSAQIKAIDGKTLRRVFNLVTLADNANNSSTISNNNNKTVTVALSGRTLFKDGAWNTLCLPFDVTIANSPLKGATARPLSSANITGTTLNLEFGNAVNELKAGTPYIIKWAKAKDYDEADPDTRDIKNPGFVDVTINATASTEAIFDDIKFVGSYSPFEITDENKGNILYIGSANKIGHSAGSRTLRSCRAHFELTNPSAAPVRTVVVDYGEEEIVTEIISMEDGRSQMEDDSWYTLSGIRLNGEPTEKGIYLFNGKKVVIQ